jgi:hypothetical protein
MNYDRIYDRLHSAGYAGCGAVTGGTVLKFSRRELLSDSRVATGIRTLFAIDISAPAAEPSRITIP